QPAAQEAEIAPQRRHTIGKRRHLRTVRRHLPRRRIAPAGTLPDRTRWLRRRLVSPLYMAPRGWLTSVLRRYAKTKNSEGDAVSSPSEPRLFSHLEFPRSVGAGDRRSHLNVDRLPPVLLRVGKPRRRV